MRRLQQLARQHVERRAEADQDVGAEARRLAAVFPLHPDDSAAQHGEASAQQEAGEHPEQQILRFHPDLEPGRSITGTITSS